MHSDILFALVVIIALGFDFTNGFHDTANVVATSISTRSVAPKVAIAMAAVLNFVGAFISLQVAAVIGKGILQAGAITPTIVVAGLVGAITWNLVTWYFGLPSSSSHALIGGMIGAMIAGVGFSGVKFAGLLSKVVIPALVSPLLAFAVAAVAIALAYRLVGVERPGPVTRSFRVGQLFSGGLIALAHGTNDAQKTMGIIALALVAHGSLSAQHFHIPAWVVLSAATAIALGTYAGGTRIIRTLGSRIIKMDPVQGFVSQGSGAAVILASSHFGFPLSTTHVISGGIMGAGAGKKISAVRWGVASNIAIAWSLTLPASALVAGIAYSLIDLLGNGLFGSLAVLFVFAEAIAVMYMRNRQRSALEAAQL